MTDLANSPSEHDAQKTAVGVFAVRVASALLLLLAQVALARWLGVAEYGLYVTLWTAVLVAGGLSHLGLNVAMMRLVPEYAASGATEALRGILLGGRLLAVGLALLVALAGAATVWLAWGAIEPGLRVPLLLALACLPMFALTDVQDGVGRGQSWIVAGLVPPYIIRPLLVFAGAVAAIVAGLPAAVTTAMAIALAATWGAAGLQTLLIGRQIAINVPNARPAFAFPAWLGISLPLMAVGGAELVLQNADVILLNLLGSSREAGLYYAAAKTTSLALFVHYAVGSAYAGRIAAAGTSADPSELSRLVREAVVTTFWPTLGLVCALLAFGYPILMLFGADFTAAYPLMFVIAIGILARAAMGPSEVVLNMLDQHRACAKSYATAACVSVALNVVLIPLLGALGASLASAAAFTTASVLNWRAARRLLGLDVFVLARAHGRAIAHRSSSVERDTHTSP